jgi:glycosyltransferase involved in cell wall biosynthesis
MMDDVRLSVALVTCNRPESLARTLASLRRQDMQPHEVVVSDDSDSAGQEAVRRLALQFGCMYANGPKRGLYANRNAAAVACSGSHIRTMDDDHEFPDGHIGVCLSAIRHDPESVWFIGEFLVGEAVTARRVPSPGQLQARGFSTEPSDPQACWAIADGATIYPRKVFDRGQRFAEYFSFGAAYLEFGSRLHWLGYRLRHLASTYIVHHYDPASRSSMNPDVDLASRVFALLCHSSIYQPTIANRMLSLAEVARRFATSGSSGRKAVRLGIEAFRKHRETLHRTVPSETGVGSPKLS